LVAAEKLKQVTTPRALTRREEEARKVRVVYGVHALEASLAGRSVQSVREALAQPLNISPHAVALVNGQEVEPSHALSQGELLEFVRYAGEKGGTCGDPLTDTGSHLDGETIWPAGRRATRVNHHGCAYDLYPLLEAFGLASKDIRPVHARAMGENLFAVRFFDSQGRSIVAYEFDSDVPPVYIDLQPVWPFPPSLAQALCKHHRASEWTPLARAALGCQSF